MGKGHVPLIRHFDLVDAFLCPAGMNPDSPDELLHVAPIAPIGGPLCPMYV
jgi:hypothetical protein